MASGLQLFWGGEGGATRGGKKATPRAAMAGWGCLPGSPASTWVHGTGLGKAPRVGRAAGAEARCRDIRTVFAASRGRRVFQGSDGTPTASRVSGVGTRLVGKCSKESVLRKPYIRYRETACETAAK